MVKKKKKAAKKSATKKKATKKAASKKKSTTKKKTKAKKTARKATKKKTTARRTTAKKAAPKKAPASITSTKKPRTKSEIMSILADHSGVSKKEVQMMFETLNEVINADISKKGPGTFTIPGLMKIVVKKKPATKAREGLHPITREPMIFKAKPARNVVKIRPLKALKDMV